MSNITNREYANALGDLSDLVETHRPDLCCIFNDIVTIVLNHHDPYHTAKALKESAVAGQIEDLSRERDELRGEVSRLMECRTHDTSEMLMLRRDLNDMKERLANLSADKRRLRDALERAKDALKRDPQP